MPSDLLAVDQTLLTVDADSGALRAAALSLVFANAAARAEANQAAGDPSVSPKAWGDAFAGACLRQLGGLGWRISEAGHSRVSQQTSSFGGSATTLAAALANGAGHEAQDVIDTLKDLAGDPQVGGSASATQQALLGFWWKNAAAVTGWLLCGLGAISGSAGAPTLALDLMQLDLTLLHTPGSLLVKGKSFQPAGVADLFAEVAANSVAATTRRSITASLDDTVFASKRDPIVGRLGDKFQDHYMLGSGARLDP